MTEPVWVLEWAGPPGIALPPTTAHRSEAGAMAAIAAETQRLGVEVVEEEATPGGMRMLFVGEKAAMLRQVPLL